MKKIEIKNRFTGTVTYSTDVEDNDPAPMRTAVSRANLSGAYLSRANLSRAKLDVAPLEVPALLAKLRAGEVDGSVYEGQCACLVGTIANLRHCKIGELPSLIAPDSSRPAERWFLGIGLGSTPDSNPVAAITDDWIVEWMAERGEGEWVSQ